VTSNHQQSTKARQHHFGTHFLLGGRLSAGKHHGAFRISPACARSRVFTGTWYENSSSVTLAAHVVAEIVGQVDKPLGQLTK
jgi:hypothetical protein